jgi:hypothetical protein
MRYLDLYVNISDTAGRHGDADRILPQMLHPKDKRR